MNHESVKDLWIEMAVSEICTQSKFALIAFNNIARGVTEHSTDIVFMCIHSFLAHCANISKMLKPDGKAKKKHLATIGGIMNISENSPIHQRNIRGHLEHYDERLKGWIEALPDGAIIGTYNIGSRKMLGPLFFVKHYDPTDRHFTFVNKDYDLQVLADEANRIGSIADSWVSEWRSRNDRGDYGRV